MDSKGIQQLLEHYRNGQCTDEEKRLLEEWFDSQSATGRFDWTAQEATETGQRIKNNIDLRLAKRKSIIPALRIAASLLLIASISFIFKDQLRNWLDPINAIEKSADQYTRLQIKLSDGSKVWLNAGSKIRYPNRFTQGKRQVELLEGEGYFEVTHDASHPFIVTSKNIRTIVLGTAFNVKSYSYMSSLQVSVTSGKVGVTDLAGSKPAAILMPNQQLTIDRQTGVVVKNAVEAQAVMAWQRGNLAFNNEKMVDVCTVLSKQYNLTINFIEKDIQNYRITAGFVPNDRIDDILSILANANNLQFVQKGNFITFKKLNR